VTEEYLLNLVHCVEEQEQYRRQQQQFMPPPALPAPSSRQF